MPRLKAQKLLDEVDQGKVTLDADSLYDTVLAATGNENLANDYRVARIKADWKPR